MSGREWKPGDLAVDSDGDAFFVVAGRCPDYHPDGLHRHYMSDKSGALFGHIDGHAARPLVVIDPEDREQVERLARSLVDVGAIASTRVVVRAVDEIQAALRSLIADPKPEEPRGLGAVVEDADGDHWVRFKTAELSPWRLNRHGALDSGSTCFYSEIAAVRVLSEGVTA